jgi:hypothetical protein
VFRQDTAGKVFDFAERHGLEAACAFKAKGEASNAAKQIEELQLAHPSHPARISAQAYTVAANAIRLASLARVSDGPQP